MAGRPRTRSNDEIFAALLRAAANSGGAPVTLAAIAMEAGLAASTLAERFGSRRALLLAAGEAAAGSVDATFDAAEAAGTAPLESLVEALVVLSAPLRTRPALAHQLGVLRLDLTDPGFRQLAERHAHRLRLRITDLLTLSVTRGELDARSDAGLLARAVGVAYNGSIITWGIASEERQEVALRHDLAAVLAPWRPGVRTCVR